MAWLINPKALARWTVGARSIPDAKMLYDRRSEFRQSFLLKEKSENTLNDNVLPLNLFPREAHILSSTKSPPDFLTLVGLGVSRRIKEIIESIEPNVHQFVPVATFLKNGDAAGEYFSMNICHVADNQINDNLTTLRRNEQGKIELPSADGLRGSVNIYRDYTTTWHAWISRDIYKMLTISDELDDLLRKAKIPGLDHIYLEESDRRGSLGIGRI